MNRAAVFFHGGHSSRVIRHGAVAASIWPGRTPSGFEYYDFTLSRSWKSRNGEKTGYSQTYFETNCEALVRCVEEASAWIKANPRENGVDNETPTQTLAA